jgi:hypothetical protein
LRGARESNGVQDKLRAEQRQVHSVPAARCASHRPSLGCRILKARTRRSEQLEFAEAKAATCRVWADRQRRLTESFAPGSVDREQAERLLVNFEALAQFLEGSCRRLRPTLNRGPL